MDRSARAPSSARRRTARRSSLPDHRVQGVRAPPARVTSAPPACAVLPVGGRPACPPRATRPFLRREHGAPGRGPADDVEQLLQRRRLGHVPMAPAAMADAILRSSVAALTTRAAQPRDRRPAISSSSSMGSPLTPTRARGREGRGPTGVLSGPQDVAGRGDRTLLGVQAAAGEGQHQRRAHELMIVDHEYGLLVQVAGVPARTADAHPTASALTAARRAASYRIRLLPGGDKEDRHCPPRPSGIGGVHLQLPPSSRSRRRLISRPTPSPAVEARPSSVRPVPSLRTCTATRSPRTHVTIRTGARVRAGRS